jgi:hypothetical protein
LLVTSICQIESRETGDQSDISAEEYAIYAAVVDDMFAGDKVASDSKSKARTLVIADWTVSNTSAAVVRGDEGTLLKQRLSSISQETIDDYMAKNAKSHQITTSFDLKVKYTLISKEKIDQIFRSVMSGWEEFYKQFPGSDGLISFSRAGLNSTGDQALVYMANGCGGLCGSGNYLLLVEKNGKWTIQKKFMAWVS